MTSNKLEDFFEYFKGLSTEEKIFAVQMINKQMEEESRKKLIKSVKQSRRNISKGKFKEGKLRDLYEDLENDKDSMG